MHGRNRRKKTCFQVESSPGGFLDDIGRSLNVYPCIKGFPLTQLRNQYAESKVVVPRQELWILTALQAAATAVKGPAPH